MGSKHGPVVNPDQRALVPVLPVTRPPPAPDNLAWLIVHGLKALVPAVTPPPDPVLLVRRPPRFVPLRSARVLRRRVPVALAPHHSSDQS